MTPPLPLVSWDALNGSRAGAGGCEQLLPSVLLSPALGGGTAAPYGEGAPLSQAAAFSV